MLGYYKKHLLVVKEMVNRLQEDPENLELLREIQLFLIKRIILTERRLKFHRRIAADLNVTLRRSRLQKHAAGEVKRKRAFAQTRVRQLQQLLFIWRAFGDAIPFIYLDKWSVKPLLYNDKTADIKQRPGFLDGKESLPAEFTVLLDALAHNVPAVLADVTNSIRHGDLCLLGGTIPFLLEVKSSTNKNSRTERQAESLHRIQEYLRTDEGRDIRGVRYLKRIDILVAEVNHVGFLNTLIEEATKTGQAMGEPEPGLTYIVASKNGRLPIECLASIAEPRVFYLNSEKSAATWMSYQPFTLLIRSSEHLYAFLRGELHILVILDFAVVRKIAAERGFQCSVLDRDGWSWAIERSTPTGEEKLQISRHFEGRVGLECLSLKWILDSETTFFTRSSNASIHTERVTRSHDG